MFEKKVRVAHVSGGLALLDGKNRQVKFVRNTPGAASDLLDYADSHGLTVSPADRRWAELITSPVSENRDNTAELQAMINAAPHSSSISGWLATLGLFMAVGALIVTPFVLAWFLLGPKIAAACLQVGMCQ